jgi:hypothetical protein
MRVVIEAVLLTFYKKLITAESTLVYKEYSISFYMFYAQIDTYLFSRSNNLPSTNCFTAFNKIV